MPLSHYELVERAEASLIAALIEGDLESLLKLCHRDIVFTNEIGKTMYGVRTLHVFTPEILSFDSIEILRKGIRFFDSVAIVSSCERRSGIYLGLSFSSEYHITRVWKYVKGWRIISTTSMLTDWPKRRKI